MTAILSTESYGTRAFGDLLSRHPGLDRTISAGVIAREVTFPLVFVLPARGSRLPGRGRGVPRRLRRGAGLNRFVWSFYGCYASVWAIAVGW